MFGIFGNSYGEVAGEDGGYGEVVAFGESHACAADGDGLGEGAGVELAGGEGDYVACDGGFMGILEGACTIEDGEIAVVEQRGELRGLRRNLGKDSCDERQHEK